METDEIVGIEASAPPPTPSFPSPSEAAASSPGQQSIDDELGVCEDQENCTSQEERIQAAARYGKLRPKIFIFCYSQVK